MAAFTSRQGQYLAFIHRYTQKFGVAPSFEDIGRHFGTTPPSVNNMIKTLCARGLLSRLPGVARSLRVVVPEWQLPESEFGGRERSSAPSDTAVLSVADVAVMAATAVLDAVMPHVAFDGPTAGLAAATAQAVNSSLRDAGASSDEALEAGRRVSDEVALWVLRCRGGYARRKRLR